MKKPFIPVAAPALVGKEKEYVLDCLESNWVSSIGKYIDSFEEAFARFAGKRHAISCCNGTAALHLALLALGIKPGDEVIVPALTFIATANAVAYCGARPVFVDVDAETWNLDPAKVEAKLTPRTKAIIPVHLYGYPADMDPLRELAAKRGIAVIEDAAEAHGAEYKGRRVGSFGDLAVFSFFGNKLLTTGEGGMVVTDDDGYAATMRQLAAQGMDLKRKYWFPVVGYNYRMTNIEAAIGLAQLEKFEWHAERRQELSRWYRASLANVTGLRWQTDKPWAKSAHWMVTFLLTGECPLARDEVIGRLAAEGIETRPVFHPLPDSPPYLEPAGGYPVADRAGARGMSLPTWAGLTREDVERICGALTVCLRGKKAA